MESGLPDPGDERSGMAPDGAVLGLGLLPRHACSGRPQGLAGAVHEERPDRAPAMGKVQAALASYGRLRALTTLLNGDVLVTTDNDGGSDKILRVGPRH